MFDGRLKLKTAPASEPVTAANVKLYTRIAHSVEDDLIDTWIAAAREEAQDYLKESFITQTWYAIFDEWPDEVIELPMSPLQSVTSIKYYDTDDTEATYDSSNYFVDSVSEVGRIALNDNTDWPTTDLRPINGVIIEYITGYGDASAVPSKIKNAIYLYCAYMYENREDEGEFPQSFYDLLRPSRPSF